MFWCDHYGDDANCARGSKSAQPAQTTQMNTNTSPVTYYMNITFIKYSFVVPIDSIVSISTFWFEVNENNGTQPTLYKNGGSGYQVQQDQLIFVPAMGSLTLTANPVARGGGDVGNLTYTRTYSLVAGVRTPNLISLQSYSQYTDSRRTQSFTGLHECI